MVQSSSRSSRDEMLKKHPEVNIRYEYSPESFTGTEMDNAVAICERVMELLDATPENKVILNLPSTVEGSTPNGYADQIEYFCKHLKNRESAIISLHRIMTAAPAWRARS